MPFKFATCTCRLPASWYYRHTHIITHPTLPGILAILSNTFKGLSLSDGVEYGHNKLITSQCTLTCFFGNCLTAWPGLNLERKNVFVFSLKQLFWSVFNYQCLKQGSSPGLSIAGCILGTHITAHNVSHNYLANDEQCTQHSFTTFYIIQTTLHSAPYTLHTACYKLHAPHCTLHTELEWTQDTRWRWHWPNTSDTNPAVNSSGGEGGDLPQQST